jgi:hypothetical protein
MRTTSSEWECMPRSAPGWIESMDAAGFEAGAYPVRSGLLARFFAAFATTARTMRNRMARAN